MKNRQEEMTPELATYVYAFWAVLFVNTTGNIIVLLIAESRFAWACFPVALVCNLILGISCFARILIRLRDGRCP